MTWIVTHRNKNGTRAQDCFEADSTQALFIILKEKGISPISISEANSKIKPSKIEKGQNIFSTKALFLIAVTFIALTITALISFIYIYHNNQSYKESNIEPEKNIKAPTLTDAKPIRSKPIKDVTTVEEPKFVVVDGRRVYRSPTNDVGRVVTNAFGKTMVIERVVTPSGPMKDGKSLVPRRIFKYDSEVAIDTLMNMDVGYKSLMMLPPNMDEDFKKSLSEKIKILPEDSEDEIRRKENMIELKAQLAQRIAAGEKISQIAAETLAHYNKIANIRETLLQEIIKSEDEGMTEDERENLYEAANLMLKEYDALPIHSPKVRKAIIRERLERNKAKRLQQN